MTDVVVGANADGSARDAVQRCLAAVPCLKPADAVGTAAESARRRSRPGAEGRQPWSTPLPVGGDSVDIRMRRAREPAERAREAEERAVEAAQESKERSDHARR